MAEEPMSKEEWSDDDMPTESWADRARDARNRLQKKLAEGGALMFALLFVFGIFFGAAAKAVAARSILIGYWDYTVSPRERSAVNLNALQQEIADRQKEAAQKQEEAAQPSAPSADATNGEGEAPAELPPLPPTPEPPTGAPAMESN